MKHDLHAIYGDSCGRTVARSIFEAGSLRLRHMRGQAVEGCIVNTGGGIVAGDVVNILIETMDRADVLISSVAAEKIYRSRGATSMISTILTVGASARLAWLPEETILFDQARLARTYTVDVAANACFLACELLQFGRTASGEIAITGSLRDSWRIRRAGRLLHAEESAIHGEIGAILDRSAVAGSARGAAQLVYVAPENGGLVKRLENIIAAFRSRDPLLDGGISAKEGILIARMLALTTTELRACLAALVEACPGFRTPRGWK